MDKNIKELFTQNGGYLKADELYAVLSRKELAKSLDKEEIQRVKHGYYQLAEMDEPNETALIAKLFPQAILCMDTALFYYGYSDRTPLEWHLAVGRRASKVWEQISHPVIRPYLVSEELFNIGAVREQIDGIYIKIYDRERVICDCLRHRNKIDIEMFNKAIQAYVGDTKKNIVNLSSYSKKLRVYKKAQDLIGVWL